MSKELEKYPKHSPDNYSPDPSPDPMPIHCPLNIASLSPEEFERVDYRVMGHAYASQNELGRLCDESAYEADLKARLLADGISSVETQVPVTVSHRDFSKTYRLDLIADHAVYELKADSTLIGEHETQLFNYLFLLGLQRGKLLNFRPPKVQGKIIATSLTSESRRRFEAVAERWSDLTPSCSVLYQITLDLLHDWGSFLDLRLYQEALIHFLGGGNEVERQVELRRNELSLGWQRMHVHAPEIAFRITAYTESQESVESHLRRLLLLTGLKAIQWINLNHSTIEFVTIQK
jgi:GxxExxY protein